MLLFIIKQTKLLGLCEDTIPKTLINRPWEGSRQVTSASVPYTQKEAGNQTFTWAPTKDWRKATTHILNQSQSITPHKSATADIVHWNTVSTTHFWVFKKINCSSMYRSFLCNSGKLPSAPFVCPESHLLTRDTKRQIESHALILCAYTEWLRRSDRLYSLPVHCVTADKGSCYSSPVPRKVFCTRKFLFYLLTLNRYVHEGVIEEVTWPPVSQYSWHPGLVGGLRNDSGITNTKTSKQTLWH